MNHLLYIAILITIYSSLAVSLNLISGYAGILSLSHAAFYGIGAYTAALMAVRLGTPFWMNTAFAVALCGGLGWLLGL